MNAETKIIGVFCNRTQTLKCIEFFTLAWLPRCALFMSTGPFSSFSWTAYPQTCSLQTFSLSSPKTPASLIDLAITSLFLQEMFRGSVSAFLHPFSLCQWKFPLPRGEKPSVFRKELGEETDNPGALSCHELAPGHWSLLLLCFFPM